MADSEKVCHCEIDLFIGFIEFINLTNYTLLIILEAFWFD